MKKMFSIGCKIMGFLAILCMFQSGKSQNIFYLENDYKYALVYISKSTIVTIRTKLMHGNYQGPDGVFKFNLVGDTILQRFGNVLSSLTDTKGYLAYGLFCNTIPIKNNKYKIYLENGDSVLYDEKKRINEIFNSYSENRKYLKQFYLNDTTILSTNLIGKKPFVGFFLLDKSSNIRCWQGGNADSAMLASDVIDLKRIDFERGIRFYYDRLKRHIDSIQQFDIVEGKELCTYTQWFVYKNGRPVKSFERNEETGKIEYQQIYTYSPIVSNRKIKEITK